MKWIRSLLTAAFFASTLAAQQNGAVVQGRVEWYGNHKPVDKGEIRIDGPNRKGGTRFLRDGGEFSFDFAAYQLKGGDQIHVSVRDQSFEELKLIDPLEGDTFAPSPPYSGLVWKVARPGEQVQLSAELTGKYVVFWTVHQSPQELAGSCDPSPDFYAKAEAALNLPPQNVADSLEKWSIVEEGGAHWVMTADPQTRCRAWRSNQIVVLRRKLQADHKLLVTVKDATPPDQLQPLYLETAKTNAALGAISVGSKDYDGAQTYLQDALTEFDHAGAGSADAKKQVKVLYDKVQHEKAKPGVPAAGKG
jgi:hypothetical protein